MAGIDLSERFGDALRQLRTKQGLSQDELAHRAGITRNYVSLLECGNRNPTLNTMAMLADALEITLVALVRALKD